jgi:hypothetical protein
MTTQLSPSQHQILSHAAQHTEGKIEWFPDNIKGGARKKVIDSMLNRGLITALCSDLFVAADGYEALGMPHRAPASLAVLDTVIASAQASQHGASQVLADEIGNDDPTDAEIDGSHDTETKPRRTRDNSRQATVIAMLRRLEGATIAQICEVTGWQAHTVRGTFAGAFKKKLGLNLTSDKDAGSERVYRAIHPS